MVASFSPTDKRKASPLASSHWGAASLRHKYMRQ